MNRNGRTNEEQARYDEAVRMWRTGERADRPRGSDSENNALNHPSWKWDDKWGAWVDLNGCHHY